MLASEFIKFGNTLIAERLLERRKTIYWQLPEEIRENECYGLMDIGDEEDMKFHCSWDWLMPIAKKIDLKIDHFDIERMYLEVIKALLHRVIKNDGYPILNAAKDGI